MNERPDMTRVLRHWFDDGPTTMPDRVVDVVADRIARQPQRPAWLPDWRERHVNTYVKVLTAIAAVVVVAVAGFAVLGPQTGLNVGVTSTPTASPSPSMSLAPSPTPPWSSSVCQPGCSGPLAAGTHTSESFVPAVTYTSTSDWVNLIDGPGDFLLYPDTPLNRDLVASGSIPPFMNIQSGALTIQPGAKLAGPPEDDAVCTGDRPGASPAPMEGFVEASETEFIEHLATQEGLAATEPIPVALNGLTGEQIDVAPEGDSMTCLPGTPFGAVTVVGDDRYRYLVLDNPQGGSLLITLWASNAFDGFVAEAMPVVESFEFDVAP